MLVHRRSAFIILLFTLHSINDPLAMHATGVVEANKVNETNIAYQCASITFHHQYQENCEK